MLWFNGACPSLLEFSGSTTEACEVTKVRWWVPKLGTFTACPDGLRRGIGRHKKFIKVRRRSQNGILLDFQLGVKGRRLYTLCKDNEGLDHDFSHNASTDIKQSTPSKYRGQIDECKLPYPSSPIFKQPN